MVLYKPEAPQENHMLAVVDTAKDEGLIIAKVVLREASELDERNFNLYNKLT